MSHLSLLLYLIGIYLESSVEGEHYLEPSIKEKRDLYDKYFPYYEFPYL